MSATFEERVRLADWAYQWLVDYAVYCGQPFPHKTLRDMAAGGAGIEPYVLDNYLRKRYPLSTQRQIRRRWQERSK